jgi:hypothetical protein
MQRAHLGVFAGEADVFVEVEAADAGGVQAAGVERLGEVLVQAGGGAAGRETEDEFCFHRQRTDHAVLDETGGDFAHVVEVARDDYLVGHGSLGWWFEPVRECSGKREINSFFACRK